MTRFDIDVSGLGSIQQEFNQLKEDWEDNATFVVGTNVEYAVFP